MPKTSTVTSLMEINTVEIFNKDAATLLKVAFEKGALITKIESTIDDPGEDYVEFQINNNPVCKINGY